MTNPGTYILLVITMFLWGGTFSAGRLLSDVMSPAPAAFLRFAIASITLFFVLVFSREKIHRPDMKQFAGLTLLGLTGIFSYNVLFFYGLAHISAGRASLIISFNPLAITLLALFFFNEKLTPFKFLGILLSLAGAAFVISNGHPSALLSGGFGRGELALLGCVLSWALYTVIGKTLLSSISPLNSVFYSSSIGTLLLLIPAALSGLTNQLTTLSMANWFELAYLGIFGTAVGFSLYYRGVRTIGATRAGVFINLVPVFACLIAWMVIGETIKLSVLSGGLLIVTGVSLANYKPRVKTLNN